ncbi:MAG: hypothetical protein ACE5HT_00690 [Gemmatimonadales bacterium]
MKRGIFVLVLSGLAVGCGSDSVDDVALTILDAPASLTTTSLNGAIHLAWADNSFANAPANAFLQYRVYSTGFSIDDGLCDATFDLEGTTIAPEFVVGALTNGIPRCFGVTAESVDGGESDFSPVWADTPRPDARNVLIFAIQAGPTESGFRFFQDVDGNGQVGALELGAVADGNRSDIDFWVDRDVNGDFFMVPQRAGTEILLYDPDPLEDLTSIDFAPDSGYSRDAIQALPRFGYVFRMDGGDGFARFGAIRITHVGKDYMLFDWSYQTDPGNPELSIHGGAGVAVDERLVVPAPNRR